MALFSINRYLGEQESESAAESRSKTLLVKLQEQVKARERQAASSRRPLEDPDHTSGEKVVRDESKKRKKARKAATGSPRPKKRKQQSGADKSTKPEQTNGSRDDDGEEKADQDPQASPVKPEGENSGFHVLGGFKENKAEKVRRVLPQWLASPDAVEGNIHTHLVPFADVPGISPALLRKLQHNGIQQFFPVQSQVIPAVLQSASSGLLVGPGGYCPRDICVSAPTGSGKTLAFVIPVVQALSSRVVCEVRALAVLPTKELAQQVAKVFGLYAEVFGLNVATITGQRSLCAEKAMLSERRGGVSRCLADVVVATPGRLVDHINQNDNFSLQHLRFLIIDEADRMMDRMHQAWLGQLTRAVYRSRRDSQTSLFKRAAPGPVTVSSLSPPQVPLQKLLFSATLTQNPEKLQLLDLHQPRLFSSVLSHAPSSTFHFPAGLTEYYVPCTTNRKPLLILHFLLRLKFSPVLCFTNSREAAHRLYLLVKLFGGVEVAEFSSLLSTSERQKTLKDFEQGRIHLLISTDAAARGIDVSGVKSVINYDAPQYIRTYIHRIGRTARAGKAGLAFTFLLAVQEKRFLQMVSDAGSPEIKKHFVQLKALKCMELHYEETLEKLRQAVKEEKKQRRL